jgi:hypothetical protein
MSPALDERDRIHAAMNRIVAGAPERSNGALTIVALALEADVPRNALTQRHTDLKNEFYEKIKERGATPDVETRLRATVVKLKETITNKNKELNQLRADIPPSSAPSTNSPSKTSNFANSSPIPTPTSSRSQAGDELERTAVAPADQP